MQIKLAQVVDSCSLKMNIKMLVSKNLLLISNVVSHVEEHWTKLMKRRINYGQYTRYLKTQTFAINKHKVF